MALHQTKRQGKKITKKEEEDNRFNKEIKKAANKDKQAASLETTKRRSRRKRRVERDQKNQKEGCTAILQLQGQTWKI